MTNLGKNRIEKLNNIKKKILGSNDYYKYYYCNITKKINLNLISDSIFIYILEGKNKNQIIRVKNKIINFKKGELIRITKSYLDLISVYPNNHAIILFVYKSEESKKQKKILIKKIKNIYSVKKPWGYEKWLTGAKNKNFAFKKIFLKKGTKTSLQYHIKKIETNFLYNGIAKLHYMNKDIKLKKTNFSKILSSIKNKKINKGSIINIKPKTIHRLEAVSDLILYEVSSPHLSDVIRVSDDNNRPSGTIRNEHKKKFS